MSDESCVIVGAGHAGGRAVEAMRACGYAGRITLVGAETHLPYERPPLSKQLLCDPAGYQHRPIRDADYYAREGIEVLLGAEASDLDTTGRRLVLADGRELGYDRLLLCTGGELRRLDVPGARLSNVRYLRTLDDGLAIGATLSPGARVVIVGGGFIGLEVAASARRRRCAVSVVEASDRLMGRAVPAGIAQRVLDMHRANGVDLRFETTVAAIEGGNSAERVVLDDGEILAADLVVIGIGIVPATALAERAGLAVDDGILTDEYCRTSSEDVYACGDASCHFNPRIGRRLRLESWHNAQQQAIAAARNLTGTATVYQDAPWFWTEQYDANLQMVGVPADWENAVCRSEPGEAGLSLFKLEDGELTGAVCLNRPRDMAVAKRLMAARKRVDAAALADTRLDLRRLLR